ncbi:UDP-N-acetylmuramoyl-L-alanine--D-glutamate ligase [Patescibacteria group bacterium]|nr:UDP-N-acetylmuramoyl-L-alanine--D-glutamate ligase [Patescibacteria group bacterium]
MNTLFENKKITLLGLGVLGRGVGDAKFLAKAGAKLTITDLKTSTELKTSLEKLKKFSNISYTLGKHKPSDFNNKDLIIKCAGVPLDSIYIKEARINKIPIKMSTAIFAKQTAAKLIGITGTRGKSTVTHLIYHILKTAGIKAHLGGNVKGVSTLSLLNKVKKNEYVILELDSWQLQGFGEDKISPQISVFTNFMPDHLNYYKGDMQRYLMDKINIFKYQQPNDTLITNKATLKIIKKEYKFKINSKILEVENVLSRTNLWKKNLLGSHNLMNIAMAVQVGEEIGISENMIKKAISTFAGVPGRLELVKNINGIRYYNDTTSTIPEATMAAINALENKRIILIAGGNDKNLEYKKLANIISTKVNKLILLPGSATKKITDSLPKKYKYIVTESMEGAVKEASLSAKKGDIVLLSPGAASFGLFINEFDRGYRFCKYINKIS